MLLLKFTLEERNNVLRTSMLTVDSCYDAMIEPPDRRCRESFTFQLSDPWLAIRTALGEFNYEGLYLHEGLGSVTEWWQVVANIAQPESERCLILRERGS